MKQKLFTLLTLLLVCISGAWATSVNFFTATATTAWKVSKNTSNADVSAKATITGGQMYVTNAESSDKDLIKSQSSTMAFCCTNNGTFFKIVLPIVLQAGDVISADVYRGGSKYGIWLSTSSSRPDSAPTSKIITAGSSNAWENDLTYTVTAGDGIVGESTFYIYRATSNSTYFTDIKISRNITAPLITTQPVSADYAVGDDATALTIAAIASTGDLTYQWYRGATSTPVPATDTEIDGATTATLAAGNISTASTGTFYYYCVVGDDGANSTTSSVATITVSTASAPTISIATPETTVAKGASVTLTATVDGVPAPTLQWYQGATSTPAPATDTEIDGATSTTYSPSTASKGTFYYYAIATNSEGSTTSNVITLTVNGSTACQLTSIKFSNSAYGAITEPVADPAANGTITVPYLSGQSAPTINESSIVVSADATWEVAGNVLTVTAEDGVTTADYKITKTAFTPLAVTNDIATTTFDAVPTWIFCPYGWDAGKGVKFAKKVNESSNMRISKGFTRQYYFIAAAKTLTLTSGSAGARNIKVYRNGMELAAPTATAAENNTIDIVLDTTKPCMITIESNQEGGDGGFTKYAVTAAKAEPSDPTVVGTTVTLNTTANMDGWRSYNNNTSKKYTVSANTKVYYASATGGDKVTLTEIDGGVPANTAVILHKTDAASAAATITLTETATDITAPGSNLLLVSTAGQNLGKVYRLGYKSSDGVGFYTYTTTSAPEGIIYVSSVSGANFLSLDFGEGEGDVTSISEIEKMRDGENEAFFNLAGQRVAQPTKGLYIVNGKKVVLK